MRTSPRPFFTVAFAAVAMSLSCGEPAPSISDAGADAGFADAGQASDAGADGGGDAGADAGPDGGGDAGPSSDGGRPRRDAGAPITATDETWTWVDFPESFCGNGAATGIGINKTARSSDLFIYLEAGGACWENLTCHVVNAADNVHTGYTATNFSSSWFRSTFATNRGQAANPFRDMSYVYVPYCTGDVHAGNSVRQYADPSKHAVHHRGAHNVDLFLSRLGPTFPDAGRVFVGGSSAGAFGAQINYDRVLQWFPNAEVHVLADCGQMINPTPPLYTDWVQAWSFEAPPGCADCLTDFRKYPEHLAQTYPDRRFGLIGFTQDDVLRQFFGYGRDEYETETYALLTDKYDPYPNAKYFLVEGFDHVILPQLGSYRADGGASLNQFVTDFVTGDAGWRSVKP